MAACLLLLAFITPAQAAPIVYTETVVGSGTLGQTPFTDALITLTAIADTDHVMIDAMGFFVVANKSTSVQIDNGGSALFSSFTETFVDPTHQVAGLRQGPIILALQQAAFGTYDLKTPIAPMSGVPFINASDTFATNAGNFSITSTTGDATSEATALGAPVPEPSTFILAGLGALGLTAVLRRCRRD
jgi:hypothetical protein